MGIALPGARAAAVAFIRGGGTTPVNPTQAETTALLAAMTVQPDATRANLINNMVFDLKGAGLWTTFDFFLVFAAHDAQAGRVGWINPARVATVNGSPTFTTDRGYAGDGIAAYLGLGTNLNALTKFTQNNCALGVWCQNNFASNPVAISLIGTTTTLRIAVNPRSTSDLIATRLVSASTNGAMTDSRGHVVLSRTAAAGYDRYKNGALLDSPVASSLTLVAEDVTFLRNATTYASTYILSCAHGGSALTAPQIATLYSIISIYMSGVGAA